MEIKRRNNRGITLIALVVTIVVLLILAGVSLAMLRGENGIISKAQKSARETRLAKTKESISLEISDAMINEAIKGNKTLTDEQLKDIVNKYGEMDEDGDTIHTDDGDLSLKDLINGTTSGGGTGGSSGSTEELAQEVEKLKTTIDTLNKQISKLEKEKEALNAKIAELQGRINELESQLSEANKSKAELEETINNLRDENTRLNNKITDLMAQLEEKNQQTTENDGTIENLKNQITELETRIQELETELANKENELANKDERIASLEEQVRDLQQQLEDSNNEISNKDAIIDSLNSTIESLTNQIESLNEQIEQLENQIEQKDAEIADLKSKQATGDATADKVLSGSTFSNSSGIGLTGTMPNKGAISGSITTSGGSYTIPAGYHNGSGKVTGPTLGGLIGSNVNLSNAANLLSGQTAYGKNGTKYTGTMANRGAVSASITTSGGSYTIPAGYHNGSGKITGPTLGGLIGSNVNLTNAAYLVSGQTAYGKNGTKYSGSMKNYSSSIQYATTDASNQAKSCYRINGSNIDVVPAIGYWGNWNWDKSCIKVPLSGVSTYKAGTFYLGDSGGAYSVNCGFQPNMVMCRDVDSGDIAIIYSNKGHSLNVLCNSASKQTFGGVVSVSSSGFAINGQVSYAENRNYYYVAAKLP